jgi:hypothetical protein
LVVSTDVPPQPRETEEQHVECEIANAARATRRQQELDAAAAGVGQPVANVGQGAVNQLAGNIGAQAPAAPAAPQPHQQRNEPHRNHLRAKDLLRDFEQDGHEVYNSPQANLGAALAVLGHLEDTPAKRCLQAHIRVATAQVEERGPGYSKSATSSYSRSRSEHPRQRRRSNTPLQLVAEEGRGENEVVQLVNLAANAATNPPANAAANAAGNVANNAANTAGA